FAEYMAECDGRSTRAYHVNLVRHSFEETIADEFRSMLHPEFSQRFQRYTWEQLHTSTCHLAGFERLNAYFENKTAGLQPAFALSKTTSSSSDRFPRLRVP